jgi:hypothetical protein
MSMVIVKMERHEEERYSAFGPTTALGNLGHGIHLSHGSHHVTKMGITGMAGAKISQSIPDIVQRINGTAATLSNAYGHDCSQLSLSGHSRFDCWSLSVIARLSPVGRNIS